MEARGVEPKFYSKGVWLSGAPLDMLTVTVLGRNVWRAPGGSAAACPVRM